MDASSQLFVHSLVLAGLVSLAGFLIGWPSGVVCGLFRFHGRSLVLAALALPLLMPSILWAIGLTMWRLGAGWKGGALVGVAGCVWSQSGLAAGLAGFAALLSVRGVTHSQGDAALLAGGAASLWRAALRSALPASLAAALLGGMLALSDSGPAVMLGVRTAAGEILAAFAARHDFAEAVRLCLWLALLSATFAVPMLWRGAATLEAAITGRDMGQAWQVRSCGFGNAVGSAALLCVALLTLVPLAGLLLPAARGLPLARALQELMRTAGNTLVYGLGAGLLSALFAWPLAVCTAQSHRRRRVILGLMIALLALPAVLPALGWIRLANVAPEWLDWLVRGRAAVCAVLAWRLLPVAFVLALRRWTAFSPLWHMAAAVHGVPQWIFLRRVILPHQAPGIALAVALVGLLACGEIGITLLLHPPGEASLPLAIFTIMANAPETLVTALCLLDVALMLPLALLALLVHRCR